MRTTNLTLRSVIAASCLFWNGLTLRAHAGPPSPNVVLILSDDQGWTDYGFMGHPEVETPHLDRLAATSLVFPRGYVPAPLCRPSLASIVTGLYPQQHGVVANDVDPKKRAASDRPLQQQFHRHFSFIRRLTENGYLAHQSGKWWEGSWRDGGFTHGMTHGDPKRGGRHGDAGLAIGRKGMKPVLDFIDGAVDRKKPFFVWYAPFLPHTPHNPPQELLAKYRKPGRPENTAKYYAMCTWFDQTCGRLLNHLEEKGLRRNTLVVYVCDNGWAALDRAAENPKGWWNGYAPRSKGSPFEMGIRTPILFSWPARVKPERSETLASSLDLATTILSACGLDPPGRGPGLNLLNPEARADRRAVFGTAHAIHNQVTGDPDQTLQYQWVIEGRWKLMLRFQGLDTTRYQTVHTWDQVPTRLYDLETDPHETTNLATEPQQAERLQRLRRILLAELGEGGPRRKAGSGKNE
jgi:arylsulfatase A-like enzyme